MYISDISIYSCLAPQGRPVARPMDPMPRQWLQRVPCPQTPPPHTILFTSRDRATGARMSGTFHEKVTIAYYLLLLLYYSPATS